jgi:RimJ/RimL family protein N-acetyltransferase
MQVELVTERLTMRRARPEDLDAIHAVFSDFEVVRHTASWPWPADRAFAAMRAAPYDPDHGMVGPVLRDGEIIGMAGVTDGEIGYTFARAHWGQGYATEIGRALLGHCFARYDWPEISAGVFAGNPASARVLEKLGFAHVGDDSQFCAAEDRVRPLACYALTRSVWQARHG